EPLLLLGHPGGYGHWMAIGGRFIAIVTQSTPDGPKYTNLISDTPGSQGTSGGPIINLRGQVVGVVYAAESLPQFLLEPARSPTLEIAWRWTDFKALKYPLNTASVSINDARSVANEIIAKRRNVATLANPGAAPGAPQHFTPITRPEAAPYARPTHPDDAAAVDAAHKVLPGVVSVFGGGTGGTGFIISSDGYIMTNEHIAREMSNSPPGAPPPEITLYDGRTFPLRVVGSVQHGFPDVAVMKIEAAGLPVVEFGEPSRLQSGDSLLLIGHPAGYGFWIVSGGRFVESTRALGFNELRSEIPHASGNSGGPLIDLRGQVVGLLYGEPEGDLPEVKPDPLRIIWGHSEFEQAEKVNLASSVDISEALAKARAIIAAQGDVP
ncbi:MAG: trypsin-like peptidase domain-containing protein, partial [Chloroflexi bacterium]|nr:trypsin-like peptidase domain-containing protein [Chloroflexota bacterium]